MRSAYKSPFQELCDLQLGGQGVRAAPCSSSENTQLWWSSMSALPEQGGDSQLGLGVPAGGISALASGMGKAVTPYLVLEKGTWLTSGKQELAKGLPDSSSAALCSLGSLELLLRPDFGPFPPRLCGSYPQEIIVPAWITDKELESVASFRSWKRIPAVVYRWGAAAAASSRLGTGSPGKEQLQ